MYFVNCKVKSTVVLCCCALVVAEIGLHAEVKLPALISDGLVLQQGMKVNIWGTADPGERVAVALIDQQANGIADSEGEWKVKLGPLNAGGPFTMTVVGKNTITVHDVLVGEVWVCSGQSNMEMWVGPGEPEPGWNSAGVANHEDEIAHADYPMLHLFTVDKAVASKPQRDVKGYWVAARPQTVNDFSAVGYFFGRELLKTLNVPIGMIHSSWGGTTAEAWTTRGTLESDPEFKSILDSEQKLLAPYPQIFQEFEQQLTEWRQASENAEATGKPIPEVPKIPDDPRKNRNRPSVLYNAMTAPLTSYAIKGVIWYQGESNADRPAQYRKLFPALIRDWRRAWGEGDFPFLFVQLASWGADSRLNFPELREAQLMTLVSVPQTGMAVTIDIGDGTDVHPKNKQDVGYRLALAAQAIAYGRDIVYSGPIYDSMTVEGTAIRLRFRHAYNGLIAAKGWTAPMLEGFEIAGDDRKFVPAVAKIERETVVVSSGQVTHPVAVRYGWGMNPICILYNQAGLPASPFRTDDW
jgi:sialate O-acetylesterase